MDQLNVAGKAYSSRLLVGTGKDEVHLVVVATAERGLCGGFNSSIVRGAREHIRKLDAAGKTVKILCVGKKGYQQLRRDYSSRIVDLVDLSEVRRVGCEPQQGRDLRSYGNAFHRAFENTATSR